MKITRIDSYAIPQVACVKVSAEDGSTGWGVEINPAWLAKAEHRASTLDEQ